MSATSQIPVFNLFGETGAFPDVVHCERIRARALRHDWQISQHRHSNMVQLFQMEHGAATVRIDGREYQLKDEEFLFIPVQSVHGFSFRQGSEGLVMSFPLSLMSGWAAAQSDVMRYLSQPVHAGTDALMQTLIAALTEAFAQTGTFRASILAAISHGLMVAVAGIAAGQDQAREPLSQRRMAEFDRLLRANLSAKSGAAELAGALGITPGHLNRICRAATGTSATAYIETMRMSEASRLLAFTQLSVAEIAYRLGYEDPPYFSRRFRNHSGETPSAYRARLVGG